MAVNAGLEQDIHEHEAVATGEDASIRNLGVGVSPAGGTTRGPRRRPSGPNSKYCRTLAEAASVHPAFAGQIDCPFVDLLEACAPLHDIGRMGIPDHVLMKVGAFSPEERLTMETHTIVAADAFSEAMPENGPAQAFLQMAMHIARSITNATMEPATRIGCRARPSRSRPVSWPLPTYTTPCVVAGYTNRRRRTRPRFKSFCKTRPVNSTRRCSKCFNDGPAVRGDLPRDAGLKPRRTQAIRSAARALTSFTTSEIGLRVARRSAS